MDKICSNCGAPNNIAAGHCFRCRSPFPTFQNPQFSQGVLQDAYPPPKLKQSNFPWVAVIGGVALLGIFFVIILFMVSPRMAPVEHDPALLGYWRCMDTEIKTFHTINFNPDGTFILVASEATYRGVWVADGTRLSLGYDGGNIEGTNYTVEEGRFLTDNSTCSR